MILTHPAIDPIIFSLGFIEVRWYGFAYVLAFLIGSYLIKKFKNKFKPKISNKKIDDFFIWAVIGAIVGGRLGYVIFYQLNIFLKDPLYLVYIWKGGMSFHGGLIGMMLSIFIFSKKNKIQFFILADLVSLVAPIGLFFGRIANFINIELVGKITTLPFAMIFPTIDNYPRHPSQLYEAFLEGILLFIILNYVFLNKKFKKNNGYISGIFLFFYGVFRFLIEFVREPDLHIGLFYNFL